MTDEAIIAKYQEINQAIDKLGKRLITKLSKYGVEKDHESFTDLIHAIGEIRSIERYYTNNSLPAETDLISVTYDGIKYDSSGSLIEFNDSLIQKLVFYIKLLKYYLALKGIDLNYVNNANTVVKLIELIDFIEAILSTSLTITNVKTEYYAGEDITISYNLIDSEENEVTDGNIEVYDNDMLVTTTSVGSSITVTPTTGTHVIKVIYKGTEKYEESQDSFSFTIKPARIILDTIIANQTESSLYYRSADTGFRNDKWYIKIITKDSKGNILPNVPLTIKNIMLDNEGEIKSNILLTNNAISDSNGVYIIQNIDLFDYGEHIIDINTQYISESISNREEHYLVNIVHNFYYSQSPFIIYYEGETQNPMVIELHDENGKKPYDEDTNTYLYDGLITSVKIINILNEEIVLDTTKTVTNGDIIIDFDLPIGYYHIILDTIVDLSINYADIHFHLYEYTIDNININVGVSTEKNAGISITSKIDGVYDNNILKGLKISGDVIDNNMLLANKPLDIYRKTSHGWEYIRTINTDNEGSFSFIDYSINSYIDNTTPGTRDELATLINTAVSNNINEIDLNKQCKFQSNDKYIEIPSNFVINGNGHIIDANNKSRIFHVTGDNVNINNIILLNGNTTEEGGAIKWTGSNGVFSNSIIGNCIADNDGGGIYWTGEHGVIENSRFVNNATNANGGAIYAEVDNFKILDIVCFNNFANGNGGAIRTIGNETIIDGVIVEKNTSNGSVGNRGIIANTGDNAHIFNIDAYENYFGRSYEDRTTHIINNNFKYKIQPSPNWISDNDYFVEITYAPNIIKKYEDIDFEDNDSSKYHVYGLFIVDVRENLDLIKNATDNNGNIQIFTTKILSAINNEDTNFIKSLTLSNDIISSESIIRDNNDTIESSLKEAIGKIYLNDDKNIEYETVGDIYSLDNRKLQYNKQQG